jgi:hypothetical protein
MGRNEEAIAWATYAITHDPSPNFRVVALLGHELNFEKAWANALRPPGLVIDARARCFKTRITICVSG